MDKYDHNDLYAAFEAGWRESYQRAADFPLGLNFDTIRHEFEDWLHNHEQEQRRGR